MTIRLGEFQGRLERLRGEMCSESLDAVLIGSGLNLAYFTGYSAPSGSVVRPFFALLPRRREPILIAHSAHCKEAQRLSCVSDVREYSELSRVPAALIHQALRDCGIAAGRIGMELGYEQALDISQLDFSHLQEELRAAELVDATHAILRLWMIKSTAEIMCMRRACSITDAAYASTFAVTREGMTELEVYGHMRRQLSRDDAAGVFLVITSGPGNYDLVSKPPDERPILRGDMVWINAGCSVSGYWSGYSRAGVVGEVRNAQESSQRAIQKITRGAIDRIRPGVPASAIAQFCLRAIDELPFPITSNLTRLAGRVGHGVGLNLTEPPHLGLHDNTLLEAGMVVSVEPGVATASGTFHAEENVVLTEDGCEVLSQAPRELRLIEAATSA